MTELLLSEKYRPKKIEDIILLPRISKLFVDGKLTKNVLFYGNYGTGKTSLARILIGKYTNNSAFMEINSSKETSIDVIRTKVDNFCSTIPMDFNIDSTAKLDDIKYVFMDEYERMSPQAQDAMKVFVEEYSSRNVRFILVTNHISKVTPGILSRFTKINFDCDNQEEEKWIKTSIYKKVMNIATTENFVILKDDLIGIINKNFPDLRATLIAVDDFRLNGIVSKDGNINIKLKDELFRITFDKSLNFNEIYHFIMEYFGASKIDMMISLFGTPFINHCTTNKLDTQKLFDVAKLICEYNRNLDTQTDPIVVGVSFIGEVRKIFNI